MLYYNHNRGRKTPKTRKGKKMAHRIFTLNERAKVECMTWDEAICFGCLETVEEFETYQEAVEAFESRNLDPECYGCE